MDHGIDDDLTVQAKKALKVLADNITNGDGPPLKDLLEKQRKLAAETLAQKETLKLAERRL